MQRETVQYELGCGLGDGLSVRAFSLVEALDEPYLAVVEANLDDPDPDLAAALGGNAQVTVRRGSSERRLCGVVRAASAVSALEVGERSTVRLEIVPALFMLSLRRNTRMFQQKSVPEILELVLAEAFEPYERAAQLELSASYPTREHCMQYQETDLEFVHRLMEEEGISYGFDHAGEVELLVLRDGNAAYPIVEAAAHPIPYEPHNLVLADAEPIHRFDRTRTTTTTKVALRDFDWTKSGYVVEDEEGGPDALGRTRESYEHGWGRSLSVWDYDAAARRYGQEDAAAQKAIRLEGLAAREVLGRGISRVLALAPGTTFEIVGHPNPGVDGSYLVTRVIHQKSPAEAALGQEVGVQADPYHNRFECVPLEVPHRPARRASKPRIPGVQTAVVTGPAGEEIHTDEHGRIKVRFHWDRENPADETSSCWVRVQQKWAGSGWGFWWIPRMGMEVVVQFVDGDPDRPLVTGCVYDGANPTPYALPDDKTKSTIKSNSSPGGGGSNELRFEDRAGSEEIYTHAQKDYNEVVENDHTTLVHRHQTNTVDVNQTQTIHANQTERVDGNQDMSIGGNRTVHVEGDFDETVDGTEVRHVQGAVSETFDANETRTIAADVTEDVAASESRTIGASQTETIGGDRDITVNASSSVSITGSLTQVVAGGITLSTPGAWNVTAVGGYTAVLPGGFSLNAPGGLRIGAPGGVQQVDSVAKIFCSIMKKDGAIQRSIVGAKFERFGANIGMVGISEGTGISELVLGIQLETKASILQTMVARLAPGAIKAGAGPTSDE